MQPPSTVADDVRRALAEDVGTGDLSAVAIPAARRAQGQVVARAAGVVCGRPWFDEVFLRVERDITVAWHVAEGDRVEAGGVLCALEGPARGMLTAERTALNFLQLLSGVATATRVYVDAVAGTGVQILDTRKTLPGLRASEKYAVACGGGRNHRMGLYDAAMLKENHIHAAGDIAAAVDAVRTAYPDAGLTVEVESLEELRAALECGAQHLLLDEFTLDDLRAAVAETDGRALLEASGAIGLENVGAIARTGIDCISIGALTKDVHALDLSLRFG